MSIRYVRSVFAFQHVIPRKMSSASITSFKLKQGNVVFNVIIYDLVNIFHFDKETPSRIPFIIFV